MVNSRQGKGGGQRLFVETLSLYLFFEVQKGPLFIEAWRPASEPEVIHNNSATL